MGMITGFLEGLVTYNNGTPKILPFQDKIEEVQFQFTSETLFVETFSASGVKGSSEACPYREEAMFMLSSKSLAWSFLQAASGYLAQDSTLPIRKSYSAVLRTTTGTPVVSTLTLPEVPRVGGTIQVSDLEGEDYTVTVAGATVTFATNLTGRKVTVSYEVLPEVGQQEIALGSGERLPEVGVYGTFFGCPDSYLIVANRGIIETNLDMSVGSDAATAAMTIRLLRDNEGNFARIIRKPA